MQLYHRKIGEGTPIIIVHGLYGMSENWLSIAKKLASDFTVYMVDVRNHGQSPHCSVHNYKAIADDLFEFIEKNNIQTPHFIGHSMGGKAVIQFASQFPEKINKLVVVDISPLKIKTSNISGDLNHRTILKKMCEINFSNILTRNDFDEYFKNDFNDLRTIGFMMKNLKKSDINPFTWKLNVDALYENIDNISAGVPLSFNNKIETNTLFLKAENSNYIGIDEMKEIDRIFVNYQIKTINGAGHWIHVDKPEECAKLIQNFLFLQIE